MSNLQTVDSQIAQLIRAEQERQRDQLQLIPSENYVSKAVLEALGSVLTNKYSEGYAGKRYYQGNKIIDQVEELAVERAKKLFGAGYVNVQPLSGTPANLAVYFALLKPGDKILSMNLAAGGHLSHGSPVNLTSQLYQTVFYNVDAETEKLDYNAIAAIAAREKPQLIIAGASAYSRVIDFAKFAQIAQSVKAYFLADIAHIAGLIATGHHPSPLPHADVVTTTTHKTLRGPRGGMIMAKDEEFADRISHAVFPGGIQAGPHNHVHAAKAVCFHEALQPEFREYSGQVVTNAKKLASELTARGYHVVSGGTDNHLLLVDLRDQGVDGRTAAEALERANIIVNYNLIPHDPAKPMRPSGIRLGTPALTSRGMKEDNMVQIANWISTVLNNPNIPNHPEELQTIAAEVEAFSSQFPVPGIDN